MPHIIERLDKRVELGKRVRAPYRVTSACPNCEEEVVRDLSTGENDFSYPRVKGPETVGFHHLCRVSGDEEDDYCEWSVEVVLDLTVRLAHLPSLEQLLAMETFQEVAGCRRWDSGTHGYSFPVADDEEDRTTLTLRKLGANEWEWAVIRASSSKAYASGKGPLALCLDNGITHYNFATSGDTP